MSTKKGVIHDQYESPKEGWYTYRRIYSMGQVFNASLALDLKFQRVEKVLSLG